MYLMDWFIGRLYKKLNINEFIVGEEVDLNKVSQKEQRFILFDKSSKISVNYRGVASEIQIADFQSNNFHPCEFYIATLSVRKLNINTPLKFKTFITKWEVYTNYTGFIMPVSEKEQNAEELKELKNYYRLIIKQLDIDIQMLNNRQKEIREFFPSAEK